MDYKNAGVDIEAGYESVELMKKYVQGTMRPEVLTNLGGFSGAFHIQTEVLHLVAAPAHRDLQLIVIGRPVIGFVQQGIQLDGPGHISCGIRQQLPQRPLRKRRLGNVRPVCSVPCGEAALPGVGHHQ